MKAPSLCKHLEIHRQLTDEQPPWNKPWGSRVYVADWEPHEDIGPFGVSIFAVECRIDYDITGALGSPESDKYQRNPLHDIAMIYHSPLRSKHLGRVRDGKPRTAHECRLAEGCGDFMTRSKNNRLTQTCYEGTLDIAAVQAVAIGFALRGDAGVFDALDSVWLRTFGRDYKHYLKLLRS